MLPLNEYADRGDTQAISRAINGGSAKTKSPANHEADRSAPILGGIIGGAVGLWPRLHRSACRSAWYACTPEAVKEAIETRPEAPAIVKQVEATKAPSYLDELNPLPKDRQAARDQTMALVEKGSAMACGAPVVSLVVILGLWGRRSLQ